MALKHAVNSHRNGSGLLRDHHNHRIGYFTHAHRCTVPGSQIQAKTAAFGKRQHTAGCRNASVTNDHGTVMERSVGKEDIADQLFRNTTIDNGTCFKIILQMAVPCKYDQRTNPRFTHSFTGQHRLGNHRNHFLLRLLSAQQLLQFHTAQMIQHSAKLRLE